MSDLRDLQDAAAAHNLQSDSPPTGSSGAAPPQTAVNNQAHGPVPLPPPPPRHLPHGWTARYDEQEKKYAYSHGVTAQEQWEFPANTSEYRPVLSGATNSDFLESYSDACRATSSIPAGS